MNRNFFKTEQPIFEVVMPINWEQAHPTPFILESIDQYVEIFPKVKDYITFESFKFLVWNFGQENWIREASMSIAVDGSRYLDTAKLRENKLRYLMQGWSLKNNDVAEPLEHIVVAGRKMLSDSSMHKVLTLNSALIFLVLGIADRVWNGITPPANLYTKEDFEAFLVGKLPERLQVLKQDTTPPKT